jgi:UDP-N-acetylmuramoylalanine--D-glutamate ligase
VLELSSYQIDLTYSLDCDVAVLLNVTPDHLDRYASFEAYAASKARLFEMQSEESCAVAQTRDWWFEQKAGARAGARHLEVYDDVFHQWQEVPNALSIQEQSRWPSLQGPHNLENAEAGIATCFVLGLAADQIRAGLKTFTGLPHRMERVASHNGVTFVNDSKATNTDSSAPALAAFPANGHGPRIHWIVGGLPKEDGLGATEQHLANVKAAYTIGEAGPRFAELLRGRVTVEQSEMLCEAVRSAVANAAPGDVVLLSPACASFDQFKDYEQRGERFRQFVEALTEDPTSDPCLAESVS